MATVLLRNTNPLGPVDLPLLGRQEDELGSTLGQEGVGCLEPGEVFEVDADLAGRAPSGIPGEEGWDPGFGLLAQVGNYELVDPKSAPKTTPAPAVVTDQPQEG